MTQKTRKTQEPLPISFRFAAAANEYVHRMKARTSLMQAWVTTELVLIAAIYSGKYFGKATEKIHPGDVQLLAVAVPLVSFLYGLSLLMHDRIMGNLQHYMMICEKIENFSDEKVNASDHWASDTIPSYHMDADYNSTNLLRVSLNLAYIGMIIVFSWAAFHEAKPNVYSAYFLAGSMLTIGSIAVCSYGYYRRMMRVRSAHDRIKRLREERDQD